MNAAMLTTELCRAFCSEISVSRIPAGLAFSGIFEDLRGDRISGYLIEDRGLPYLSDDGSFLSDLESSGIDFRDGNRAKFLEAVLADAGAFVDMDTLTIRTPEFDEEPNANRIARFLAALSRAQDVAFWNRERVKSTFADDLYEALILRLGPAANIAKSAPVNDALSDFPADLLISSKEKLGDPLALFLVQNTDRLNEATLLSQEMKIRKKRDAKVVAVSDTGEGLSLSSRRVSRALNRIDGLIVYRHDEDAAIDRIAEMAGVSVAA